ncbi:MAG: hypothetical protein WCP89_02340 [archaeon]
MAKTETSQTQIVEKNIEISREELQKAFLKDEIIIFFTRVQEDLQTKKEDIFGRLKELFAVIFPYEEITRDFIFEKIGKGEFEGDDGIKFDAEEKAMLVEFCKNLDKNIYVKNFHGANAAAKKYLLELNRKYLPNMSLLIEPFLVGKLISFFGGIDNLYKKPASTIQLIGAEKAFFRFKEREATDGRPPKYGLIYRADTIQKARNKGKKARQLANKLSLAIKLDYFQKFCR